MKFTKKAKRLAQQSLDEKWYILLKLAKLKNWKKTFKDYKCALCVGYGIIENQCRNCPLDLTNDNCLENDTTFDTWYLLVADNVTKYSISVNKGVRKKTYIAATQAMVDALERIVK